MLLDVVNVLNGVTDGMWKTSSAKSRHPSKKDGNSVLPDDLDGENTLEFLKRVYNAARLMVGNEYGGSLGLDHAVYFYGDTGRFLPPAFLASLSFVQNLHASDEFYKFTSVRKDFEEYLVRHKGFVNQLGSMLGSRRRPLSAIVSMYRIIYECYRDGSPADNDIWMKLKEEPALSKLEKYASEEDSAQPDRKRFSKSAKATALLYDILESRARCSICGARLPPHARSQDHVTRVEDGGLGNAQNLQFAHPYCNTGYKERSLHLERSQAK